MGAGPELVLRQDLPGVVLCEVCNRWKMMMLSVVHPSVYGYQDDTKSVDETRTNERHDETSESGEGIVS